MKLFMSGAIEFNPRPLPSSIKKVKEFLDKSKSGKLFTTSQVCVAIGLDLGNLRENVYLLPRYSHKVGNKRYFGKPITIEQLKKEEKTWKSKTL